MSDHTQAPWTISPVRTVDGEYMVVGGPGKEFGLIAAVTEEADARLIAAAPDLLDALKQCAEYLGSIPAGGTREPLYIAYKAAIDLIERTEGAGPSAEAGLLSAGPSND